NPFLPSVISTVQGRTDHLETRALPEGPGSVGGPMRCPLYLFHRLFLSLGKDTGAPWSPIALGPHELSVRPWNTLYWCHWGCQ
ncbi:unnamed protein product, partial [Staurois parvus]